MNTTCSYCGELGHQASRCAATSQTAMKTAHKEIAQLAISHAICVKVMTIYLPMPVDVVVTAISETPQGSFRLATQDSRENDAKVLRLTHQGHKKNLNPG